MTRGFFDRNELAVLVGLLAVALATRLYGIWEWTLVGDEFYTVTYAAERAKSLMNPAYYVLVLGSRELFGPSMFAARLPSALLGAFSVPVFYYACRVFLDRRTALIGALLILFSDWHLHHSQFSRFYTGVFIFSIIAYFSFYQALIQDNIRLLLLSLAACILGILFHATAVLVPAACGLFAAAVAFSPIYSQGVLSRRVARIFLIFWISVGVLALPWLLDLWSLWDTKGEGGGFYVLRSSLGLVEEVGIAIITSAAIGWIVLWRDYRSKAIFLGIGIAGPLVLWWLAALVLPNVRGRYIIYTLPLILAGSAFLCSKVYEVLSEYRYSRAALAIVLIAGMLPSFISYYSARLTLDISDPIRFIEENALPSDIIIATGDAPHFLLSQAVPRAEVKIGHSARFWSRTLDEAREDGKRIWVLLDRYRNVSLNEEMESWLLEHAALQWRKYELSFGYESMGFEVYLADPARDCQTPSALAGQVPDDR